MSKILWYVGFPLRLVLFLVVSLIGFLPCLLIMGMLGEIPQGAWEDFYSCAKWVYREEETDE